MDVALIVFAIIAVALATLWSVGHRCTLDALQQMLDGGGDVVLLIAHPDDESMFFVPTLRAMAQRRVYVLCLSTGDANGLGAIRRRELERALQHVLGHDYSRTPFIVDDPQLRDGMNEAWPETHIAVVVERFLRAHPRVRTIFTFDERGVSSHPNHIAVCRGVRLVWMQEQHKKLEREQVQIQHVFELESTNVLRKYTGIIDLLASVMSHIHGSALLIFNPQLVASYRAMSAHESQFVWYRRLFVAFSRYGYLNTWKRLE